MVLFWNPWIKPTPWPVSYRWVVMLSPHCHSHGIHADSYNFLFLARIAIHNYGFPCKQFCPAFLTFYGVDDLLRALHFTVTFSLRLPRSQTSWLQAQRSRVQSPALPDLLNGSGSGTGPTQPREDKWGATWKKSSGCCLENRLTTVGDPPRWPRDTTLFAKVGTKFRQQVAVAQSVLFTCGLKATEFVFCFCRKCDSK
jgi:hypothetical protein